jgi:hypothetical protein
MRGKLWFLGGAAVGFVIGARAGRERYDQLMRTARNLWDHPTTQEAAGVVQEQASRLYTKSKDTVGDKISQTRLGEKLGAREGMREPTSYPPVTPTGPQAGTPGGVETDPITGTPGRSPRGNSI